MRVLAAPDKFRGTLTAAQAAAAIAEGWRKGRPGDDVEELPLADGGEGTLDTLVAALGGRVLPAVVTGPLGEPVEATYGVVEGEGLAIVEMARASGLAIVPKAGRDPLRATTRGTGELLLAACRHSPSRVIVCIGGSATTDGGAGMAQALGIRLLDADMRELPPGGAALLDLASIDATGLAAELRGVEVLVACDVDNPLAGPQGAAAVYGPQKGATPEQIDLLDRALRHYAEVLERDLGVAAADVAGAGAAGGLGAGLIAFLGAELRPGVDVVMDAVRFEERLQGAGAVVTGEGKVDEQSLRGKTPAGVLRVARQHRVPVVIACGQASVSVQGARLISMAGRFGLRRAFDEAADSLTQLVAELARKWAE
ncbi:MAG: glycerate kinase [Actinomycetota bacterium]